MLRTIPKILEADGHFLPLGGQLHLSAAQPPPANIPMKLRKAPTTVPDRYSVGSSLPSGTPAAVRPATAGRAAEILIENARLEFRVNDRKQTCAIKSNRERMTLWFHENRSTIASNMAVENGTPNGSSARLIATKDPSSLPMRMSGMWLWRRLLVALILFPVSFSVVFWASTFLLAQWDEAWRPAWMGNGAGAEAIVILPADTPPGFSAELVPFSLAKDFAANHPGATFLIPRSEQGAEQQSTGQQNMGQQGPQQDMLREKEVEEQLRPKLASLSLDVKQLPSGAQQISIEDMDRTDDTHGTRYEASKDGVRLIRYRFVGDRDAMGVLLAAMGLSFLLNLVALVCVAGWFIYRWRKGSRGAVMAE